MKNIDDMNKQELRECAKTYDISVPPNISDDNLRTLVSEKVLEKQVRMEMEARERIRLEYELKERVAKIKAEAAVKGVTLDIEEPYTLEKAIAMEQKLKIVYAPKVSPETQTMKDSKKIYAMFTHMEQANLDAYVQPGTDSRYHIHFYPDRVHVIPEAMIQYCKDRCWQPLYSDVTDPETGMRTSKITGRRPRFMLTKLEDAPDDAPFGCVTDEDTLKKLGIEINKGAQ